jgi:mannose-1-phosphate guanylyltransferase
MKKNQQYAIILSGGSGERFWPLSTSEKPKQFLTLFGGKSLLRQSIDRLNGFIDKSNILIITNETLKDLTYNELPDIPQENIICEPCRRDTAAAIALACSIIKKRSGDNAIGAVLTADQLINNKKEFHKVLKSAFYLADKTDNIITIGIKPTFPATNFGYIKLGKQVNSKYNTINNMADKFVEKPNLSIAKRYIKTNNFVWNGGMFIWKVSTLNKAILDHTPYLYDLSIDKYNDIPKISFDYALMEKISNIVVISADFGWDDVGTWLSAEKYFDKDNNNNSIYGEANLLNCNDSIIVSNGQKISAIGIQDLIIVSTNNNVFVTTKSHINDIKKLLNKENT